MNKLFISSVILTSLISCSQEREMKGNSKQDKEMNHEDSTINTNYNTCLVATKYMQKYVKIFRNISAFEKIMDTTINSTFFFDISKGYNVLEVRKDAEIRGTYYQMTYGGDNKDTQENISILELEVSKDTTICYLTTKRFCVFGIYSQNDDCLILFPMSRLYSFKLALEDMDNEDIIFTNKRMTKFIIVNYKQFRYTNIWKVNKVKSTRCLYTKLTTQEELKDEDFHKEVQNGAIIEKRDFTVLGTQIDSLDKLIVKNKWYEFNSSDNMKFVLYNPLTSRSLMLEDLSIQKYNGSVAK